MLLMTSDYYLRYTNQTAEKNWQRLERLDYCDHPLRRHRLNIHRILASLLQAWS